jgi:hypothetical protein
MTQNALMIVFDEQQQYNDLVFLNDVVDSYDTASQRVAAIFSLVYSRFKFSFLFKVRDSLPSSQISSRLCWQRYVEETLQRDRSFVTQCNLCASAIHEVMLLALTSTCRRKMMHMLVLAQFDKSCQRCQAQGLSCFEGFIHVFIYISIMSFSILG